MKHNTGCSFPLEKGPEFGRSTSLFLFKYPVEGGNASKASLQGGIGNIKLGIAQENFRVMKPLLGNIINKGNAGVFPEQP